MSHLLSFDDNMQKDQKVASDHSFVYRLAEVDINSPKIISILVS